MSLSRRHVSSRRAISRRASLPYGWERRVSPIPFAIDHATMTYHSEESTRSLTLKRALVSSLQLARVERSALASGPLLFSATEEDKDGTAKADYIVRRGLIGRTTYIKHSTYEPTR